jgi:lipopolysaccharide transport system ATP-binding protein
MTQAIEAIGLSKRYLLGQTQAAYGTLRDSLVGTTARLKGREQPPKREEIWALRDVSFNVREGEVLGVIGRRRLGTRSSAGVSAACWRSARASTRN